MHLLSSVIYGQVDNFDIEYPWSGDIYKLKEDARGYIWFHDGHDYYSYNGHQVNAHDLGQALGKQKYDYEIKGDIIFIGDQILFLHDDRISFFHPSNKTIDDVWSPPSDHQIDHLYQDDVNDIWVFTSDNEQGTRPVYLSSDGVHFNHIMDLPSFNEDTGIFWDFEITDKDGDLYIHDRLGGLLIIDKQGEEKKLELANQADFDAKYACSIFRLDNKNQLWRIWEDQYEIYDESQKVFISHPLSGYFPMQNFCNRDSEVGILNLRSIYVDTLERVWLANAASYFLLFDQNGTITNFRKNLVDQLGGSGFDIDGVYEDKNGNIWGFKKGGIFKIRDKVNYFQSYTVDTYRADHPIYQDQDNAALQKILKRYDDYAIKYTSVHSIGQDKEGHIYYQDGTLSFKIDAYTKQLEILPFFIPTEKIHLYVDNEIGLFSCWDNYFTFGKDLTVKTQEAKVNYIQKTFRQKNGTLWFAGLLDQHNNMFGLVDNESLEYTGNYKDPTGKIDFTNVHVTDITEDENEALWVSSDQGIMHINVNKNDIRVLDDTYTYDGQAHKINQNIDQLYYLGDDQLWYKNKYEVGLINTKTEELLHRFEIDEAFHGPNMLMLPEGDSAIWIGNKHGIGYHNFNNQTSIQVSKEEGIDCKDEVRVLKRSVDEDRLIAGTNNGLYLFNPDSLINNYQSKVVNEENIPLRLTSYTYMEGERDSLITNIAIDDVDQIRLAHNDRNLALSYSLINYNHPSRNRYQYRLEGYDNDWSTPNNNNITTYSNLPPGEYTFQVKGTIGSGVWSKQVLSVPILVKAAWYNTWWASLLVLLIVSFGVYLFFRNRYQQILKYEQLRSDISQDLHDDVGSMLTGIAMQTELLEQYVDDSIKPTANKIASKSREAISKMRDTVWAIDARKDTSKDLLARILDFIEDTLIPRNITYNINTNIQNNDQKLSPDKRQNVYLIIKESINNIAKHSDTTNVDFSLQLNKKEVSVSIKDYGSRKKIKKSGQGLSNLEKRARSVKGSYSFNYDGDGYLTKLSVPL